MSPHLFSGSHDAMSYCLDITSPLLRSESDTFRLLDGVFCCFTRPAIRRWATTQAGIYFTKWLFWLLSTKLNISSQRQNKCLSHSVHRVSLCLVQIHAFLHEKCICIKLLQTGAKHCGATCSRHSILWSSNCPQTVWFFQWALLHSCHLHTCNGHCKYRWVLRWFSY